MPPAFSVPEMSSVPFSIVALPVRSTVPLSVTVPPLIEASVTVRVPPTVTVPVLVIAVPASTVRLPLTHAATIADRLGVERIAAAAGIERPRIRQRAVLDRAAGHVERAAARDGAATDQPTRRYRQRAGIGDGGTGEGKTSTDVKITTVADRLGIERIAAAGIERSGNVQRAVLDRGAGQVDRAAVGDRAAADRGAALYGKAATDVYAATIVDRLGVERVAAAADIERPGIGQRAALDRAAGHVERAAARDGAATDRPTGRQPSACRYW